MLEHKEVVRIFLLPENVSSRIVHQNIKKLLQLKTTS